MLAVKAGGPFDSDRHLFEIKWDGYRCLAFIGRRGESPAIFLQSRNGKDLTPSFPELTVIPRRIAGQAIIDGELVVFRDGKTDFFALQRRASLAGTGVEAASQRFPATLMAFDLIHLEGRDLHDRPCHERREYLQELLGSGDETIWMSPTLTGSGTELWRSVIAAGHEGLVAKEKMSPYRVGQRSPEWLKIVRERYTLCTIGGVTPGRNYGIGSLLLGAYADPGAKLLRYVGQVGSGINREAVSDLAARLRPVGACPFADCPVVPPETVWVQPTVVCEVSYRSLTPDGHLRHPVFRGIRSDAQPSQCLLDGVERGPAAHEGHHSGAGGAT